MAAAGAITVVNTDLGGGYTKYSVAWVSDGSGDVAENPLSVQRGHIHQVKFVPDAGGTQPTDQYDVTLLDADGLDILLGAGADRSNAAASLAVPLVSSARRVFVEAGEVFPTVAGAGDSKGGRIDLIVGP